LATVKDSLVIANPLPSGDGYTWTLASRLGEMISEIEAQFGKRDRSWTILGIEFCDTGPKTFTFPLFGETAGKELTIPAYLFSPNYSTPLRTVANS
jgi:hypothetical protein